MRAAQVVAAAWPTAAAEVALAGLITLDLVEITSTSTGDEIQVTRRSAFAVGRERSSWQSVRIKGVCVRALHELRAHAGSGAAHTPSLVNPAAADTDRLCAGLFLTAFVAALLPSVHNFFFYRDAS